MKLASIPFFLAHRFIFGKNNSYAIKIVTWICFSAIVIGCMALTLIFAIMQGFESTTSERLQSIYPQVIIQAPLNQTLNWEKLNKYLTSQPDILAITPYALTYGVLHNPSLNHEIDLHQLSLIKAIDFQTDGLVSKLTSKIKLPNKPASLTLTQALKDNQVVIGTGLARNLNLAPQDQVEIFIPSETNSKSKSINFKKIKAVLAGTIQTGIAEFDDSLIITSLDFAAKNFHEFGIQEIGLKLNSKLNAKQTNLALEKLRTDLKLNLVTWQELYAPVISALKLEKYTGISIAILIILMACMSLIALLFMLITQHKTNVAILTILGLTKAQIKHLFLLISLIMTSIASLIGMLLASAIGLIIKNYHFIELPDAYLITSLPITLAPSIFAFVFSSTLVLALIATHVPLNLINKLNLAQLLKTTD